MEEFKKEKVRSMCKISESVISEQKMTLCQIESDFVQNMVTTLYEGVIYSKLQGEKEIIHYCDKPTFFDWLFARRKKVVINIVVKDLLELPPVVEQRVRIYDINKK